jgi:tryptophan synthase beta chain
LKRKDSRFIGSDALSSREPVSTSLESALKELKIHPFEDRPLNQIAPNSFRNGPDENGRFGIFGGRFVAETLMPLVLDLEQAYARAKVDPAFHAELQGLHKHYVGRPSPLYFAERITEHLRTQAGDGLGAKVYFKRDELNHTGAHKINNVLGQILLARRMGKQRIIAETGAGQHGVATATACARFGLKCVVYMGAVDVERQKPNVFRMKMLGAEVIPVQSGARTLKDAMNEALRDWVTNVADTFYCIGTAAGPHPYPAMVRDFQSIIGTETRAQMQEMEGRLPDSLVACIGGGSNAIGLFHPFLDDAGIEIYGVEAAGHGVDVPNGHAASLTGGRPGVLHGNRTYLLQDADGQITDAHSISAGLDYPGIGPEHAWLHDVGRATYLSATDDEALDWFQRCAELEGIIPALEPAHALARLPELAAEFGKDGVIVFLLSGCGDKDVATVAQHLGRTI